MEAEQNISNPPLVYCFGEALWDIFSHGPKPGGAPMNVAYHLGKQGIATGIITSIGDDENGKDLLNLLHSWHISTALCSIDREHPTGTVIAAMNENNEPQYTITEGVAWDYITIPEQYENPIADCKAFVYGSLAARNDVSYRALLRSLSIAPYRVFDINIRPPFYTLSLLSDLLHAADLLKMNETELNLLMELLQQPYETEDKAVHFLREQYGIDEVLLTKGSAGAKYYVNNYSYEVPAVPVDIKDTVGSGDAFLAGFLSKKLSHASPGDALINASIIGAFVATHEGACPAYEKDDVERFSKKTRDSLVQELRVRQ